MNPVPCPSLTGSGSTGFSPLLGHIEEIVVVSDTTNAADRMLAALRSPDEETRIRALHRVCPCAGGFSVYERYMDEVRRLKKDPSLAVRRVALHVERDASEIEAIEAKFDRAEDLGVRFGDSNHTRNWLQHRGRTAG